MNKKQTEFFMHIPRLLFLHYTTTMTSISIRIYDGSTIKPMYNEKKFLLELMVLMHSLQ